MSSTLFLEKSFPIQFFRGSSSRASNKSDYFYFTVDKGEGTKYTYGPFRREAAIQQLRQLEAMLPSGMSYMPSLLDATLKGHTAIIKVNPSILATIWRDLSPAKKSKTLESIEHDVERVLEVADQLRQAHPLECGTAPRSVLVALAEKLDPTMAEDVALLVEGGRARVQSATMIEMVLRGFSPEDVMARALNGGIDFPLRVGEEITLLHDLEVEGDGVLSTYREGLLATVEEVTGNSIGVRFDTGDFEYLDPTVLIEEFTPSHGTNRITESVKIGDQFVENDGVTWEVYGLDFSSNQILAVDPRDNDVHVYIDMDEFNDHILNGSWKKLEDHGQH